MDGCTISFTRPERQLGQASRTIPSSQLQQHSPIHHVGWFYINSTLSLLRHLSLHIYNTLNLPHLQKARALVQSHVQSFPLKSPSAFPWKIKVQPMHVIQKPFPNTTAYLPHPLRMLHRQPRLMVSSVGMVGVLASLFPSPLITSASRLFCVLHSIVHVLNGLLDLPILLDFSSKSAVE